MIARIYGLYDRDEERTHHPTSDDFTRVFHLVTVGTWLLFVTDWLLGVAHPDLSKAMALWALAIVLITTSRSVARHVCRRSLAYVQNTVIVGAGDVGQGIARKLLRHPEYGMNLVGFIDNQPRARQDGLDHVALLGGTDHLVEMVRLFDVERVLIAFTTDSSEQTLEILRSLNELDVQVDIVPRLYELVSQSVKVDTLEGVPVIALPPPRHDAVVGDGQTSGRRDRGPGRPRPHGTAVRVHRLAGQARLAGPHLLPPDAAREEPAASSPR